MNIYECFNETKCIYDLATKCYLFLVDSNSSWFEFYKDFIDYDNSKLIASDKEAVKALPELLRDIISKLHIIDEFCYSDSLIELCKKLKKIELSDNINIKTKHLIIAYSLLIGIDTEVKHIMENTYESMFPRTMGPLGSKKNADYGLYLRYRPGFFNCSAENSRIIDRVTYNIKKPNNSKAKPELPLHDYSRTLKVLLFVKKSELEINGLPHLKKLPKALFIYNKPSTIKNIAKSNKIRVAVCALSNERNFSLDGQKYIEYPEDASKTEEIFKKAINEACLQNANFIIFPEYTFSPNLYKKIFSSENIEFISKVKKDSNLLCIFSGSTWTKENQNIMHIFAPPKIHTLYSKYVPYIDPVDKKRTEPLNNKVVYCSLLYIPGIGYILPSICRDIIDEYTKNIAKYFNPSLVFISANSKSVEGFNIGTENLTSFYHSSSIFCNDCSARDFGEENISYVTYPTFTDGGNPVEQKKNIQRSDVCKQCGTQSLGCVFLVDYSFSNKTKVGKIKQIVLSK